MIEKLGNKAQGAAFSLKRLVRCASVSLQGLPERYLFIVGHMRSGSTLLVHILNSNAQIIGYGETYARYSSPRDLTDLGYRLADFFGRWKLSERYAMDKILHSGVDLSSVIANQPNVYLLYLLRDPVSTLSSLRSLARKFDGSTEAPISYDTTSESGCLKYYTERLEQVGRFCLAHGSPQRRFFLNYEQLVSDTPATFLALESWLQLKQPLSSNYKMHKATGDGVTGDPSERIKAGRVLQYRDNPGQSVSCEGVEQARAAYDRCYQILSDHCSSVPGNRELVKTVSQHS